MDDLSKKYETFIQESLQALSVIGNLYESENQIYRLVTELKNGTNIKLSEFIKILEDVNYNKTMIHDIVSSIKMYSFKVEPTEEDLYYHQFATQYNGYISNVTLNKVIPISSVIPDFTVTLNNLGFNGISIGDKLKVTVTSPSISKIIEKDYIIDTARKNIGDKIVYTISNLTCPADAYEYNVSFYLSHNNIIYMQSTISGVNIAGRRA